MTSEINLNIRFPLPSVRGLNINPGLVDGLLPDLFLDFTFKDSHKIKLVCTEMPGDPPDRNKHKCNIGCDKFHDHN